MICQHQPYSGVWQVTSHDDAPNIASKSLALLACMPMSSWSPCKMMYMATLVRPPSSIHIRENQRTEVVSPGIHGAVRALEGPGAALCNFEDALLTQHVVARQQHRRVVWCGVIPAVSRAVAGAKVLEQVEYKLLMCMSTRDVMPQERVICVEQGVDGA